VRVSLALVVLMLVASEVLPPGGVTRGQSPRRHNDLITVLERGQAVFGSFASHVDPDGAAEAAADPALDYVIYPTEHDPYDITQLRTFLQFMLDPAAILKRSRPGTDHPVIVQLPANGREMNQWMVKQVLAMGVHGVMFPHTETAEQALSAVRAMRYPQRPGVADFEPNGQRGSGGNAARYWGLSNAEYRAKADVWPLDPSGELLSLLQIENELGVSNVRDILRQVKGITMVYAAQSDLSTWYAGDATKTEAAVQAVLAACKEFNVVCGISAGPNDVEQRLKQGFRSILTSGAGLTIGRKAAGRTR
jgi:4-hydroxy-2-oxoheptanedioate aldolase